MSLQVNHNLNDIGKCCGPTAQKISKQISNHDVLDYGSRVGDFESYIYMSSFVISRAIIVVKESPILFVDPV